jgi:DNA-binding response OmpR family regulator
LTAARPGNTVSTSRILIIDDRADSLSLLLAYFQGHAFDVMVALDGAEGIDKAVAGQPDAILLDVEMPGLDGYEVCRRLKQLPSTAGIPVIFLSASGGIEDRLAGFAAGGVDYISKPFSIEEVMARLFVHLRLARAATSVWVPVAEDVPGAAEPGRDLVALTIDELQRDDLLWPGLETLAHRVGTNEKKLTELFRERFGMSAHEYVTHLRLERARVALASSELQIQQIADRAGYLNPSDFSRAFRKRYGLGPRRYRQASLELNTGSPDTVAARDDDDDSD